MKKNIGATLALYPAPVIVVGAMVDGKPNWTLVAHAGTVAHSHLMVSMVQAHYTNKGIRAQGFNEDETLVLVRLYKLMLKYPKVSRQKILDDFEFNNITKSRDYYYSIIRNILGLAKLYTTDKVAEYVRDIVMDNLHLVSDAEVEEMHQKLTGGYIYRDIITKDDLIYILDGIFNQKRYAEIASELNEKNGKDIDKRILSEFVKRLYKGDFERNLTESDLKSFGVSTYEDLVEKTRKYARVKTKDTAKLIEAEA